MQHDYLENDDYLEFFEYIFFSRAIISRSQNLNILARIQDGNQN